MTEAESKGRGAVKGGFICFIIAAVLMLIPAPTFFVYLPLLLVAFVLAIVAMAQGRTGSGLSILLCVLIGAPIVWILGFGFMLAIVERAERLKTEEQVKYSNEAASDIRKYSAAFKEKEASNLAAQEALRKLEDKASLELSERANAAAAQRVRDEELAAREKEQARTVSNLLVWHQKLAGKGDAYGQLKMGLRYLAGDGVAKDPQKARQLLTLAASQGNKTAAEELQKLSQSTNSSVK